METKPETESLPSLPPGTRTSQLSLTIAPKAAEAARKQLQKRGTPDSMIRLGIRGAGCSGFTYVIEFEDKEPRDRDRVFEQDGVKFVVDKKSLLYLAGTILEWEQKLMSQGFKFVNPNEKNSCGCGHSFTV
jgi:iron-sulfur cluster assembly protein